MKVFFASMHPSFSRSLAVMLRRAGYEVYTPDFAFAHELRGQFKNTEPLVLQGASQLSQAEFNDTPMDVLFLLCKEQELGSWWGMVKGPQPNAKVVHYAGNDNVPYDPASVEALIAADTSTLRSLKPKKGLQFYPILPLEDLPTPRPDRAVRAHRVVGSYVINLHNHWPQDGKLFDALATMLQTKDIALKNHNGEPRATCWEFMWRSLLTVHFKGAEGYGYSVLESMAMGVPVLTTRRLVQGRTLERFIQHNTTGWMVNTIAEAESIILGMDNDRELLQAVGERAQAKVRELIYEPEQIERLRTFLEEVVG